MFDFSLQPNPKPNCTCKHRWKNERQTDIGKQKKREKRLEETRLNFALFIVIVSANIDI